MLVIDLYETRDLSLFGYYWVDLYQIFMVGTTMK